LGYTFALEKSEKSMRLAERLKLAVWLGPLTPFLAALLVGAVLLLFFGANPVMAYAALIEGAFGSQNALADIVVEAPLLLFVGASTCISFRGGVINIGAVCFRVQYPDFSRHI
jgi:simple sugar transport system permease protein